MQDEALVERDVAPIERIQMDEIDPRWVGLAGLWAAGGLGYWMLGQKRKAVRTWLIVLLGSLLTCGTLYVFAFVAAYDAYLLAQKLELGESIDPDQNALPFLHRIFR